MQDTIQQANALETRARSLVLKVKKTLKDNPDKIDSGLLGQIRARVEETEGALRERDYVKLEKSFKELAVTFDTHLKKFQKSKLLQNLESLVIAIVLALFIRTFIVQPFKIPTGSMIPTLLIGDHLLVNKFIYGIRIPFTGIKVMPIRDIKRGDIVVFTYPNYEKDPSKNGLYYIKRVVGLPGDRIDIEGRNLVINGEIVPLRYVGDYELKASSSLSIATDLYEENLYGKIHKAIFNKGQEQTQKGEMIPVDRVPDGMVFVMGDNRDNSLDSRFWGFVPIKSIAGEAFLIHWSWNPFHQGILDLVRWDRIGRWIK
jgi:signal peptidase I